jgi:hypothetical protein
MADKARPHTSIRKAQPSPSSRRWLLFVHQLPPTPSNVRVHAWRRLQHLGALPIKQSVYVLPDTPAAREDFEWLKTEIKDKGGDASIFAADSVDQWSDDALVDEFRRTRQEAYIALAAELERALAQRRRRGSATAAGRPSRAFGERLKALERIDFFGSAGRDRVAALLAQLDGSAESSSAKGSARDRVAYAGRLWVTRPRPGVDRMSSAWLIRRFIDPAARFGFARDAESMFDGDGIPFDMFGVEFSHRGAGCTFETLCAVFGIEDKAVGRIAAIVHDLDLKDGGFGAPEAPTVGALVDGLQLAIPDDAELLERGITTFEALYRAFALEQPAARPRPVAKPNPSRRPRRRT